MNNIAWSTLHVPTMPQLQSSPSYRSSTAESTSSVTTRPDADAILRQNKRVDPQLRESIKKALEQEVLLFEYASKPQDAGLTPDPNDENSKAISDELTKIWESWATEVVDNATAIYQHLVDNEAVFMTLWHPNMYGGDVTHVSAILIGKQGDGTPVDVKVAHHESVPIKASKSYDDGRLPGTLGLRTGSYDTRALFAQIDALQGKSGTVPAINNLPVMRSVSEGGLPNVSYKVARNFQAAVKFLEDGHRYAKAYTSKLTYAPFASNHDNLPEASYPLQHGARPHALNATQINNCFDATLALADVAQVDGHQKVAIRRADVDAQTRMMMQLGLMANTAAIDTAVPAGIAGFKKLGTTVALDPNAPDFQTQGTLIKAMKNAGISLDEYRKSMTLLSQLPKLATSAADMSDKPVATRTARSKL